ncbi:hypothetical protein EHQ12_04155 [Leptospira gomenensis]|uniref:Uncharacterized protein n=1 Tax=Leptospira gomenensis TaxID=2484974 RepID=A0A5F1YEQ7_9LEPT|nr:hypothetical protein [Leptospira gomenensis]TGK36192.1 hypothetical protein EHQ17_04565 [Leptospira gomenensis]TGK42769.1 hypothetical protein EHQ07_13930 [Leptospira gomenensis]TGK42958.1 hypothetical protein EHQ12_04155 [Leptospira gomenensis]TGK54969.1 hypothetical protein EHQ13_18410 [Leptospira gomenensis]
MREEPLIAILKKYKFEETSYPDKFYGPGQIIATIGDEVTFTLAGRIVFKSDTLVRIQDFLCGYCVTTIDYFKVSWAYGKFTYLPAKQVIPFEERLRLFQSEQEELLEAGR